MDAKQYLEREINRLAEACKTLTRTAEDENRDLRPEEKTEIDEMMATIGGYKGELQAMKDREELKKKLDDLSAPGGKPSDAPHPEKLTMGESFVKSEGYQTLKERGLAGRWSTGPVEYNRDFFGGKITDGAGVEVVGIGDVGGAMPIQPQFVGVRPPVENVLTVASRLGSGVATQNTIVFLEEQVTTPGALSERYSDSDATVSLTAEGATKPAANIDWVKRSKALSKIAAFMPVSDEMIEDEPQLASYVNTRLGLFIRQAEDAFLIDEIEAAAGTANATEIGQANNWFDAIAAGIMSVQAEAALNPDTVLMNPRDFWTMSVSKSAGDGNYFGGSPYNAVGRNPWGIPVLVSTAITAGTAIVGAFAEGATLWRKGGLTVEASNSHSDYFRRNLTALRAEQRIALTIFRPAAFQKVTRA